MIELIGGALLLAFTIHKLRDQTADPFWFSALSGVFEISRTKRPVIYWLVVTSELLCAIGLMIYGLTKLI